MTVRSFVGCTYFTALSQKLQLREEMRGDVSFSSLPKQATRARVNE